MDFNSLRKDYHKKICEDIIRFKKSGKTKYPNFADSSSKTSVKAALGVVDLLGYSINYEELKEQTAGKRFEEITKEFIEQSFTLIQHLRPGKWFYSTTNTAISGFEQYSHLARLENLIKGNKALSSSLGRDYIVKPDIIIARHTVSDDEINLNEELVNKATSVAYLTPFRNANQESAHPILHASISCKWTIRSDRSQNTRTEALNLIRNRKGKLPHIVAVTAEPLPTRIAALALGTGDLDCVYHFALTELRQTLKKLDNQDQVEMLDMMIDGDRLRDISDLPLDLAV